MTITVAGRPSARMVPIPPRSWRSCADVAEVFRGPADPEWETDRERVDDSLRDLWSS